MGSRRVFPKAVMLYSTPTGRVERMVRLTIPFLSNLRRVALSDRDHRDETPQGVEAHRLLTQMVQDFQRPLVQDLVEEISMERTHLDADWAGGDPLHAT
jgi:hypothetical protein